MEFKGGGPPESMERDPHFPQNDNKGTGIRAKMITIENEKSFFAHAHVHSHE